MGTKASSDGKPDAHATCASALGDALIVVQKVVEVTAPVPAGNDPACIYMRGAVEERRIDMASVRRSGLLHALRLVEQATSGAAVSKIVEPDPKAADGCGAAAAEPWQVRSEQVLALQRGIIRRCNTLLAREAKERASMLMQWRHGWEARRDSELVFQAASEGRPLELGKRLRLGVLAGGLDAKGEVEDGAGGTRLVSPLEAARLGGHDDCVKLLSEHPGSPLI